MGLSAPFFQAGWGDLGVVDFKEAESLLRGWPPEHFDTKAGSYLSLTVFHPTVFLLFFISSDPANCMQVEWRRVSEGVRHGVPFELLEGTFRWNALLQSLSVAPLSLPDVPAAQSSMKPMHAHHPVV
jgi:hypothetical protein